MKWTNKRIRTTKREKINLCDYYHNKSSSTSASAEAVISNKDLSTEILLRVPVKSLMYLKFVSKDWLSLITSPHFSLLRNPLPCRASGLILHCRKSLPNQYKFISLDHNTDSQITGPFKILNFVQDISAITILQSCNGLLLCRSSFHYCGLVLEVDYYIYNPTTNQFTTLPKLGACPREVCGLSLAFDPSKSPHYKVVCVSKYLDIYQIEVYSSESGPWRVWGQSFAADIGMNFRNGVYCNGSIHWINDLTAYMNVNKVNLGDYYLKCLYFNVYEERLETMSMPRIPFYSDDRRDLYFVESDGHLHITEVYHYSAAFTVYEMKSDYSGWFVKYEVDLAPLFFDYREIEEQYYDNAFELLSLVKREAENEEDDSFLVLEVTGKVIRYNLAAKTTRTLWECGEVHMLGHVGTCSKAYQYIESLSSV